MNDINQLLFPIWNLSPSDPWWLVRLALFIQLYFPKAALGLLLAFCVVDGKRWRSTAAQMVVAMVIAWLIARGIQACFPQPRPLASGLGHQWVAHSSSPGFPSTHSSVALAFGFVGLLSAPRRWVGAVCCMVGLMIAWSRVALGVHFPMDVMGGGFVAAVVAFGVRTVWNARATPYVMRSWHLQIASCSGLAAQCLARARGSQKLPPTRSDIRPGAQER